MKLSVVVPCYNEKDNIPLILERFSGSIGNRLIEVILVDNGSTDGSDVVLDVLIPKYPFARRVTVPVNKGYGYGIVTGLKTATGDYIGWTHADMQTDPNDVSRAYDKIADLVNEGLKEVYIKGNRKKRPLIDQFFTLGMSLYETLYLKMPLWDINAQPNIFPRVFFESLMTCPDDFSLDLYMYYKAKKKKLPLQRIDVRFTQRIHGQSKWNDETFKSKWKFIKRTLEFSKHLKNKLDE
ncbi:MAG TPA: glycosyl transferase family 2 [Clostridiales bacterium UBA8960]|nr:glycosyl transferase family 2 [Clostridiales bacterium UBA8960]